AQAWVPDPRASATRKLTAPRAMSPARTSPVRPSRPCPEVAAGALTGRPSLRESSSLLPERSEMVHDVPPVRHREGLPVRRHDRAAVADVVGEVAVGLGLHPRALQG